MKKLLNTIYVTRQESYLHKERETIVIKNGDDKLGQFPALAVSNIVCFGNISVSPFLMGYCGEQGIGLSFHTEYGKFLARVVGQQSGNVLLRRTQYRWADDAARSLSIAKSFVGAKIANSRAVLQRELRNHSDNAQRSEVEQVIEHLALSVRHVERAQDVPAIRGIEGDAAASYFSVFNSLIRGAGFVFDGRVRRPATDPVNALMSFIYSLITSECSSALQSIGLDPQVGFLHTDRPGRSSLALDMLEEFRAAIADRLVLTLINRKQVGMSDFLTEASGAIRLKDDARKAVLVAYQNRKQEEIMLVLVTYDVSVLTNEGRRRLRQIAKVCLDHGMRVQNSVFECEVDPGQWVTCKNQLLNIYEPKEDSLRFYMLGSKGRGKIEHHGAKVSIDISRDAIVI